MKIISLLFVINVVLCGPVLPPSRQLPSQPELEIIHLQRIFNARLKVLSNLGWVTIWLHNWSPNTIWTTGEQQYLDWVLWKSNVNDLKELKVQFDSTIKSLQDKVSAKDDQILSEIRNSIEKQKSFYFHDLTQTFNSHFAFKILESLFNDPNVDPVEVLAAANSRNVAFYSTILKLALKSGFNPEMALEEAAEKNCISTLQYLLKRHPTNDDVKKVLEIAASNGQTPTVVKLLKKKTLTNLNEMIKIAITNSARNIHLGLLNYLLRHYKEQIRADPKFLEDTIEEAYVLQRFSVSRAIIKVFPYLRTIIKTIKQKSIEAHLTNSKNHVGELMAEKILTNEDNHILEDFPMRDYKF